ncbi:RagB/SusD family nutrient uptake outer membrane protein [Arenibacter sp. F20364]|uniref:RagB/SusD family nutrient uptake outer membrane protein n=1 Tax=Arenibacter sp. F20364 TaxID=2926415 RepID=UPI001FF1A3B6|nr:RagB/SusD family nutrient uptake outer membrane protein [Arenibacter sp. F20364]MCK0191699.1 RagB/SusD family nutrient uptake outer membrane protein [Arenibacter sp. F20364]
MKNIIIFSVAIGLGILSSCNDDFLERLPETEIAVDNFFNTEEDLAIYVNGLYNFPGYGLYYDDEATDNAATTGNREIKTMMTTSANSSTITSGWNWQTLRDINLFLENSDNAVVSEEIRNHYNGVARFFRAQFYMAKIKRYSNVPWYDEVLSTDSEDLYKPSDSREFVLDKIFEDYQFAVDNVLEDQPSGAVNKWVVLAYAGRSALYEGTFRKHHDELNLQGSADAYLQLASSYSKQIIDGGVFAIHNTGNPNTDYYDLFISEDLTTNDEIVFSNISIANVKNNGFSVTVFGNYEMSPAKDLVESYLMADGSYYSSQPDYETKTFVEEFQNRDPRLSQTFSFPGWELINVSNYSAGVRNYVQQLNKNFTGYHLIKGFINSLDIDYVNGVDVPLFRYAEVLLTYAEAQAELGTMSQSILDITVNELRNRAGLPNLTMGITADPVLAESYPDVNSPVLLEIRRERRVELAQEGRRLDDLNRWNAGKLMEKEPVGPYFPGLGKYDLTGDGVEDIILIAASEVVPEPDNREVNSLGVTLIYYRVGNFGDDVDVYLTNGTSGNIVANPERGTFTEPKDYYRPIPATEMTLNPSLEQVFGWE